jgi:hypothetical protein
MTKALDKKTETKLRENGRLCPLQQERNKKLWIKEQKRQSMRGIVKVIVSEHATTWAMKVAMAYANINGKKKL